MARPIRIELAGGLYHVTSRGDRREAIYLEDGDRGANAFEVHYSTVSMAGRALEKP